MTKISIPHIVSLLLLLLPKACYCDDKNYNVTLEHNSLNKIYDDVEMTFDYTIAHHKFIAMFVILASIGSITFLVYIVLQENKMCSKGKKELMYEA
jgi:hypothetical protein